MFRTSSFGDILKLLPRQKIASFVKKRRADFRSRCFFTWDHLVAMLADANNVRDYRIFADIAQSLMAMTGPQKRAHDCTARGSNCISW